MSDHSQMFQTGLHTHRNDVVLRPFLVKSNHGDTTPKQATSPWCLSRGKRCFDLLLSIPLLLLLLPLLLLVACFIRMTSPGPALFRQERVGLHGKPFRIVKFRTMTHTAEGSSGPHVTRRGDPRMTPLGTVLRRLKLDELPQLFNVIRGHMSLVGPRPKLAEHELMYLTCRPGVTGAATVAFVHEEAMLADIPEHLVEEYAIAVLSPIKHRLDARYAAEASLATDLGLLLCTAAKLKLPGANRWLGSDTAPLHDDVSQLLSVPSMPMPQAEAALFLHPGLPLPERFSI